MVLLIGHGKHSWPPRALADAGNPLSSQEGHQRGDDGRRVCSTLRGSKYVADTSIEIEQGFAEGRQVRFVKRRQQAQ
jgi:hypothetical protein